MVNTRVVRLGLAGFLGGLAFFGWAPWGWWPLLLLAVAGLYQLVNTATRPQLAGVLGLCFGLAMHLGFYATVFNTLIHHMGSAWPQALLFNVVVLVGMALFTALPCLLYAWLMDGCHWGNRTALRRAALFASLWVLGEFMRALIFPRMSFLSSGYALIDTWYAGFAPLVGSYGVGWLGVFTSALCVGSWGEAKKVQLGARKTNGWSCMCVLSLLCLGFGLQQQPWVEAEQTPFQVKLVQSGVASPLSAHATSFNTDSQKLVDQVTAAPSDLVITSETAFPMYWHEIPAVLMDRIKTFSNTTNSALILGVPTMNDQFKGSNSMVFVQPNQSRVEIYSKVHLFPLGEYVPWGLGWLANRLQASRNDLISGGLDQKPFQIFKNETLLKIGTVVCNEILLSDVSRHWAPNAHALINPANTAWFWQDVLAPQILQIARMRALEVGRPLLHISKTGGSALVSAKGEVMGLLTVGPSDVLDVQLLGAHGMTPYVWLGDWPVLVLCVLIVLLAVCGVRRECARSELATDLAPATGS